MARKHGGGVVEDPTLESDPTLEPIEGEPEGEEPEETFEDRLEEIQDVVRRSIERAIDHYEENLEPDQAEATDYYMGRPFGDEEEGRSKVVSTDVRDATHAQIPSLLRIFFSPEKAVEFRPRGPEDEAQAEQMTDAVNYVITEDNPGLLIFDSWFKDALVRRLGWVKWWWEEKNRVEATNYSGLGVEEVAALNMDPDGRVEVVSMVQDEAGLRFDVRVIRQEAYGCAKFACIPPEEVVFTPNARSLDEAPLVAHVREVPREDLIALGIPEDLIEEAIGKYRRADNVELEEARQVGGLSVWEEAEDDTLDESQKPVLFAEAYCLVDGDGDGIAELRLFQCVGPEFEIANGDGLGEIVDEIPFAVLTPHPEPHSIVGLSNHDLLKDVQRVKSQIIRGTLDSLALALEPVTEVVEGQVNMSDLLNPEATKIVRTRAPGMMREVKHQFVGPDSLPMLGYWDEIKENRTGQTKAAAGLDADSLQSSTKAAVAATLSASQQRIEYIARIFAETGVKRLFRGLLRLMVKHQNRERMIRLRNEFVPIDPRHWDATMDVSVNVALGQGAPEDRLAVVQSIFASYEKLMGAGAPFVNWVHVRNTLAKGVELAGFKNADPFYGPWGPEQQEQYEQMLAQQPPPPDPQAMLVQIEAARVQNEAQFRAKELEIKEFEVRQRDDREREEIARDFTAAMEKIKAEFMVEIANLKATVEADRRAMDANDQKEAA